jgi:uncharacterized damage-inducible protein DinB
MLMKDYLAEAFLFNDTANRKMLKKMEELSDKSGCIRYFSHLINSQVRWLARIREYPANPPLDWWLPLYPFEELGIRWDQSLQDWLQFLESKTEEQRFEEVDFIGFDGGHFAAQLKDIVLQLNYHSIHHRAQMQMIIRGQGVEPDFIDYIGTRYRKMEHHE